MKAPAPSTGGGKARSFRSTLPTLLPLALVLLFLFAARIVYAPLLLNIEESLSLSHAQATSFFLFVTLGYGLAIVLSGFVAARLTHRLTIVLSVLVATLALGLIAAGRSLLAIRAGLVALGAGAGLYFPSGIPTLTSLVDPRDEGKALAVHEVGPNLAFVLTPLLIALLLPVLPWRSILGLLAGFGVLAGLTFLIFAPGGRFRGEAPRLDNARLVLGGTSFWILATLFALGAGAGVGVFSIIPTYLVVEQGMRRDLVNTLVGLSRISGLGVIFIAGYLVDRLGVRWVLTGVLLLGGAATAALGLHARAVLLVALFLQPIVASSFFPAGFAAASRIAAPRLHNLTLSFLLPIGYGFGAGVVPMLFGVLGDRGRFASGFLIYGALLVLASVLPFLLRLAVREDRSQG